MVLRVPDVVDCAMRESFKDLNVFRQVKGGDERVVFCVGPISVGQP